MAPLRKILRRSRLRVRARYCVTGVGKASAAARSALELAAFRPSLAIYTGCAGAYPGSGLRVGDVVIASAEVLGDDGVEAPGGFLDLRALGLPSARTSQKRYFCELPVASPLASTLRALQRGARGSFAIRRGRVATVSTGSGTQARALELERRTRALAETLEGAGAALAALLLGRRLVEVRGISNLTGRRDRGAWDIPTACERAAGAAVQILAIELGGQQ